MKNSDKTVIRDNSMNVTTHEFTYKKEDNRNLFKSLEENTDFGIFEFQNYIPLYNLYFSLTKTNYNSIILNHKYRLHDFLSQESNNIFLARLNDINNKEQQKKKVFLKYSPLLDPVKYLLGKYDITDTKLLALPLFDSLDSNEKVRDYNNSAYVDSFFTYLTSKLLNDHGFVHGLDFYGSFLASKTDFRINIIDDIDYLEDSAFFRKNDKVLYELEYSDTDDINNDTRNYKKKLTFIEDDSIKNIDTNKTNNIQKGEQQILQLSDITDLTELDNIIENQSIIETELVDININIKIDELVKHSSVLKPMSSSSSCSCSSRTSNTTAGDGDFLEGTSENDDDDDDDDDDEDDNNDINDQEWESVDGSDTKSDSDEEETLIAKIKKFPVQVIALEQCESTLDDLMINGDISTEQWDSIVMQILFSLITFQKVFGLTHNDLHTNNIMYVETDKKFLYYKFNHVYYKVPTFGKLFKIIDFGRAIYKFRGKTLCSDSYHPTGDAATQYNCEPYFNDKKPRLDPNFSFDLCRLGCALYDYLVDEPITKIGQIILDWVKDDKGRNILYKKNGDERYPDFKLYKMIARTVNNHIPASVLSNPYFDRFITSKKEIKKNNKKVMDVDDYPCYM